MTDLFPDEEGYICDGMIIGFCKAVGTIALNNAVSLGVTSVSGVVSVVAGAADADSVGIALKAAVINDIIPVLFYGVVKVKGGSTITAGDHVINDSLPGFILPMASRNTTTWYLIDRHNNLGGTAYVLGLALQNCATTGDELLILVGGIR